MRHNSWAGTAKPSDQNDDKTWKIAWDVRTPSGQLPALVLGVRPRVRRMLLASLSRFKYKTITECVRVLQLQIYLPATHQAKNHNS